MIFSKVAITPVQPLLEVPASLWADLVAHLRQQSGGVRESGGFVLGRKTNSARVATVFLPYEQLEADALHDDFVSLSAASFAMLWSICRTNNLSVVADIHTHRFSAGQSLSDRTNPMVALPGHIALILPNFGRDESHLSGARLYVYRGEHRWQSLSGSDVDSRLRLRDKGGQ